MGNARTVYATTGFTRILIRIIMRLHIWAYRISYGELMGRVLGTRVLLLSTTGRKTGRSHTVPLGSISDGGNHVVVASNGGKHWHPEWWLNLKSNPNALIEVGYRKIPVVAQQAQDEESERLTPRFPWMYRYQKRTSREIPVVILRPLSE